MANLISNLITGKGQKKILLSAIEPQNTEWLWLRRKNGVSTLYDYNNGKWQPLTPVSADKKNYDLAIKEINKRIDDIIDKNIEVAVDLSNYYTKSEVDTIIANNKGNKGDPGKDGVTPHIEGGIWFIGDESTGVAVSGADGVGISNIEYTASQQSGGTNTLTITLTNGNVYTCNIMNGIDGQGSGGSGGTTVTINAEASVLNIGGGTFAEAKAHAVANPRTMFQWILQDTVNGTPFKKMIWCDGNGHFIDAFGYEISDE